MFLHNSIIGHKCLQCKLDMKTNFSNLMLSYFIREVIYQLVYIFISILLFNFVLNLCNKVSQSLCRFGVRGGMGTKFQLCSSRIVLKHRNMSRVFISVFKDFLMKEVSCNSKLVVIATTNSRDSIHPSLLTSHGTHVFNKTVEISLPTLEQRCLMLSAILRRKNMVLPNEDLK